MAIHDWNAEEYHAHPAMHAGMVQDIVGPDGCLALAWWNCPWLNQDFVPKSDENLENGVIVHLAALEQRLLEERITIIDARDWRTKEAKRLREDAYANGLLPILLEREPGAKGPSFQKIVKIRKALEDSEAAPLLFGDGGQSEVSFTWEVEVPADQRHDATLVRCKARADRVTAGGVLVDLKTAPTASQRGFEQSMVAYGHHHRAAWYLDGWMRQEHLKGPPYMRDYLFVVVAKEAPHLVSVYRCDERSLEWGRRLYRRALSLYTQALRADHWPGYTRESVETLSLPAFAEHRLADLEAIGEL
jgi:hypothetical protein